MLATEVITLLSNQRPKAVIPMVKQIAIGKVLVEQSNKNTRLSKPYRFNNAEQLPPCL